MALYLITGAPGSGKTLFTLHDVEKRRAAENREVYYSGIAELQLPWVEFDKPEDWNSIPVGSIIVIDECQRFLRPRFAGSKVPEYVEQFETHRHKGYDIYLITQHPLLIDTNVRRLIEQHQHIMRKFGSKWVTVHQWKGVKENCDKTRADSIATNLRYPKVVFGWYKSAEVHTHKTNIPFKVLLAMLLIPALFVFAAYFYYFKVYKPSQGQAAPVPPASIGQSSPSFSASPASARPAAIAAATAPQMTAQQYLQQFIPVIPGLPHTAPRYAELTTPKRVPTIRGCWITTQPLEGFDHKAVCMLDGGVYIYPPESFVQQYLRDRFFIDWENPRAGDLAAAAPRSGDAAMATKPATPSLLGIPQ